MAFMYPFHAPALPTKWDDPIWLHEVCPSTEHTPLCGEQLSRKELTQRARDEMRYINDASCGLRADDMDEEGLLEFRYKILLAVFTAYFAVEQLFMPTWIDQIIDVIGTRKRIDLSVALQTSSHYLVCKELCYGNIVRSKSNQVVCYQFTDFPIEMDDTSFNIMARYTVGLLHVSRFDMIFVRVKWMGVLCPNMCAMISFGSTENEIRKAVEECADNLERYDHLGTF
ncbi:hypothetical protein COOONC_24449 [Cooperia oncophora]